MKEVTALIQQMIDEKTQHIDERLQEKFNEKYLEELINVMIDVRVRRYLQLELASIIDTKLKRLVEDCSDTIILNLDLVLHKIVRDLIKIP